MPWLLVVLLPLLVVAAPASAAGPPRQPKVRAITAFVNIDRDQYVRQIAEALAMLRPAKASFEKAGYEVQTIRITTQPFSQYVRGMSQSEALQFFHALDALSVKEGFALNIGPLNIGPALQSDEDDPALADLLGAVLAATSINASLMVAADDGIHWNSIRAAARVMKYLEANSPQGQRNFGFAATAMLAPYAPFYPGSYHNGPGRRFSVGIEAGNFVADVFARARSLEAAPALLSQELAAHAKRLEETAGQVQRQSGWAYMGLDATPAPGLDSSIGAAIETLTGAKFGAPGTMAAAKIITDAVRSLSVKRVGYSGLMLPTLEDPVLAERWSERTYNLDSLLAYSAVCGTGLDTVPLPGDTSQEQLEKIIADVASLAVKWNKPLAARLMLVPGKKAGERTEFAAPFLTNTIVRGIP